MASSPYSADLSYFLASEFYDYPAQRLQRTSSSRTSSSHSSRHKRSYSQSQDSRRPSVHSRSTSAAPSLESHVPPVRTRMSRTMSTTASSPPTMTSSPSTSRPSTANKESSNTRPQLAISHTSYTLPLRPHPQQQHLVAPPILEPSAPTSAPRDYSPLSRAFASLAQTPAARGRSTDRSEPSTISSRSSSNNTSAVATRPSSRLSSLHRTPSSSRDSASDGSSLWPGELLTPPDSGSPDTLSLPRKPEDPKLCAATSTIFIGEEEEYLNDGLDHQAIAAHVGRVGVRGSNMSRATLEFAATMVG